MTKVITIICSLIIAVMAGVALADLNYTQGSGTIIFDFLCFGTKHCSAHVPIDSTGTEKATTANPWTIDTGTSGNLINAIKGAIPAGTNSIGMIGFDASNMNSATPFHALSAASNNATSVKAGAGTIFEFTIINTTNTAGDFRLYNVNGSPTCSSATGVVENYPIQGNTVSPGIHIVFPVGLKMNTGISFCYTGLNSDSDNTNAVTGININLSYN